MKILTSLLGGLAGALALNVLHESLRRVDNNAPRIDLVGEEAVNRIRETIGAEPQEGNELYVTTLAGDIVSNTLFYSLAGISDKNTVIAGAAIGAAAGVGAVCLTGKLGLDDEPVTRNHAVKVKTIAYYTVGGIAAGLSIKFIRRAFS